MFGLPIPPFAAKAVAYALIALSLVLFGRWWGASGVYHEWIASNATAEIAAVKIRDRQEILTERVRVQYRERVVEISGAETIIEKEVTRYADSPTAARALRLDHDWLRIHNAAASANIVPSPPGGTYETTGETSTADATAAEALRTVTGNYAIYHRTAARLEALQSWVRGQYHATNGQSLD